MQYIIPLLWLLGVSGFFVVVFDKKIEECFPIAIISVVNIMIITGFMKKLSYGYYISLLMIILFLFIVIYKVYKDKNYIKTLKNNFLTLGLLFFIIIYIYIMVMHRFTTFRYWDEFMHWGFMAKESFRINAFYSEPGSWLQIHRDYPPFSSILEVLWSKLSGNYYSEPFTFRAMSILTISFIFPIFKNFTKNKKDLFKGFIFITLFLLVQVIGISDFFPTFTDSIYTDYLIGILLSYGLFSAFTSDYDLFGILNISMVLIALLMTKQMGLPFYLLILLMVLLKLKLNKKRLLLMLIFFIVIPLSYYIGWSKYIDSLNLSGQFSLTQISVSELLGIMQGTMGKPHQIQAYKNFMLALTNRSVLDFPIKLNYILALIITTLLITITSYTYKLKDFYKYSLVYLFGGIGYAFAMLLLYIFSFNDLEGPMLASYERYMGTYIYLGFVLLVFILFDIYSKSSKKLYHYLITIILIFSFVLPVNAKKLIPASKYEGYLNNEAYTRLFYTIDTNQFIYNKIMLVSQYQSDIGLVAQYYSPFNYFQSITLGPPKYDGDYNAWNISVDEFKTELKKYEYIYIYMSDDVFYKDYWTKITDIELLDHHTYKINVNGEELSLTMID